MRILMSLFFCVFFVYFLLAFRFKQLHEEKAKVQKTSTKQAMQIAGIKKQHETVG